MVGNDSAVKHDRTANPAATNSLTDKHKRSIKLGCFCERFVSSIAISVIKRQKETVAKPMIVVLRPSLLWRCQSTTKIEQTVHTLIRQPYEVY